MANKLTPKGARQVTETMDRLATLLQNDHETLGIPKKFALEVAYKCDVLADTIEKGVGLDARRKEALSGMDVYKEPGFNPEEIGVEKSGPLEQETDEPYMRSEFTQQENRELREKTQTGDLSSDSTSPYPQSPSQGVQASSPDYAAYGRLAVSKQMGKAARLFHDAAGKMRTGVKTAGLANPLTRLASMMMQAEVDALNGTLDPARASAIITTTNKLLPKLADADESTMGLMNNVLRVMSKEDDEDDKDKKDLPPWLDKDKKDDKKAHGFNLFAE